MRDLLHIGVNGQRHGVALYRLGGDNLGNFACRGGVDGFFAPFAAQILFAHFFYARLADDIRQFINLGVVAVLQFFRRDGTRDAQNVRAERTVLILSDSGRLRVNTLEEGVVFLDVGGGDVGDFIGEDIRILDAESADDHPVAHGSDFARIGCRVVLELIHFD